MVLKSAKINTKVFNGISLCNETTGHFKLLFLFAFKLSSTNTDDLDI